MTHSVYYFIQVNNAAVSGLALSPEILSSFEQVVSQNFFFRHVKHVELLET